MADLRVGVIYWDRTGSSDTYFGHHIAKSLSPFKYRNRTPYYADIVSKDKIAFHVTTQEEYDRELMYAIDAGIDYFAYTWNSDEKEDRRDFPEATEEQIANQLKQEDNTRRKLHTRSSLKEKIKMCAILLCSNRFTDNDLKNLINEMKKDYYEKVEDRPLIYLYGGYRTDFIERIRKCAKENGVPNPYIAFVDNGAVSENGDYSMADAVSGYSYMGHELFSPMEFCKGLIKRNEKRKQYNVDLIPLFSLGWNPTPRIDNIVPWYSDYDKLNISPLPTKEELKENALVFGKWLKENQLDHTIVFAWNEFEEGAWLCPTYTNELNIDDSRIKMFLETVKIWKMLT